MALVMGLLTACGVPLQNEPQASQGSSVPFGLLDTSSRTSATTAKPPGIGMIYLVDGTSLQAVGRALPSPPSANSVLSVLASGPTDQERQEGLTTRITDSTLLGNVRSGAGLVQVEVSEEFTKLDPADELLAVGQVVLTVTANTPGTTIAFSFGSEAIPIPLPGGSTTSEPVERSRYEVLVAP